MGSGDERVRAEGTSTLLTLDDDVTILQRTCDDEIADSKNNTVGRWRVNDIFVIIKNTRDNKLTTSSLRSEMALMYAQTHFQ